MTTILFPLLLAATNVAQAQNYEVSLNTGVIGTNDDDWHKIQFNRSVPGAGLTLGKAVGENLSVIASFQTGTVGSQIYIDTDQEEEWIPWEDPSLHIAATIDQYAVGATWRVQWLPRVTPTLTGSAIVAHGRLRMDEDIEMEGSEVELKYVSVSPGASVGAGIEYTPIKLKQKSVLLNLGFEAGYAYIAPFGFKERNAAEDPIDVGQLDMNGFYIRWSIGTRF